MHRQGYLLREHPQVPYVGLGFIPVPWTLSVKHLAFLYHHVLDKRPKNDSRGDNAGRNHQAGPRQDEKAWWAVGTVTRDPRGARQCLICLHLTHVTLTASRKVSGMIILILHAKKLGHRKLNLPNVTWLIMAGPHLKPWQAAYGVRDLAAPPPAHSTIRLSHNSHCWLNT